MKKLLTLIVVSSFTLGLIATAASALPDFARANKLSCATCHVKAAGGPDLNDAGKAFKAEKKVPAASVAGAEYVGENKCKMCHMKVHKPWVETPHAKALQGLVKADAKTTEEMAEKLKIQVKGPANLADGCLQCHVTGLKLAGGYPQADSTKTAGLAFVGCESCHGPGSKHVAAATAERKNTINGAVSEKMCKACHTPEMSPKFDFATYSAKVHPIAAAAPK